MCAICGILNFDHNLRVDRRVIQRMTDSMAHRGPDDRGEFVDRQVGLGHRRLSIIDLSGGKQPIANEDESAVIIFNGEIYNYRELTAQLRASGHLFRTSSDTEAILHAYEEFGEDCVHRLRGMFAFAIWDCRRQCLLLARDRLGIKPLYYYAGNHCLAFASEIKALLEIPFVPREVDPEALDLYLSLRYVPGPRTIFKNIYRLQPGYILAASGGSVRIRQYWDIEYREPEDRPAQSYVEEFLSLLDESVRLRLIAEVPLGLFLSGGLDSSAILAMMSEARRGEGIQTYSVGYAGSRLEEKRANEFDYARIAAETFAADHNEVHLEPKDFESFIPELVWYLDEPLADTSCIPLYFISKLARESITVVLSGEGADEILAGYGIYRRMLALDRMYSRSPLLARSLAPGLARLVPWDPVRQYLEICTLPLEARYRGVARGVLNGIKPLLLGEERARRSGEQLDAIFSGYFHAVENTCALNRMLYVDAKVWLPDDLLLKADKMTMANGLELRVPFLDHKLVEFAAGLPPNLKLHGAHSKVLLRRAMQGLLPDVIRDRPKKGFPTPVSNWLRTGLRGFARDTLLGADAAIRSYVNPSAVRRLVVEHEQGRADRSQELWTLLVLESWHQSFMGQQLEPVVNPTVRPAGAAA
jgi:asparagine synthase (glutamine-hydrolysing)